MYDKMVTFMKYVLAAIITFLILNMARSVPLNSTDNILTSLKQQSTFKVQINNAPTEEHRRAIDQCISITRNEWASNVPIGVKIIFEELRGSVLGAARPTANIKVKEYNYPISLAKSITNGNIDSRFGIDVRVQFNEKRNWYTGFTDAYRVVSTIS